MAFKASYTFLVLALISNILLVTTVAGEDKKEPQFLFKSDGGVHIPGLGHFGFPPKHHFASRNYPFPGENGGAGAGTGSAPPGLSYVPGGDDTFVPNPGYEVPIPGSGGNVPTPVHP